MNIQYQNSSKEIITKEQSTLLDKYKKIYTVDGTVKKIEEFN